jgi:5'-phosphate synthase pdxT subunit
VFIRAPSIEGLGKDVQTVSKFNEKIVAVRQGNILGVAFHPELTTDVSWHRYFVSMIKPQNKNQSQNNRPKQNHQKPKQQNHKNRKESK